MESYLLITNICLVLLTGIYVFLTFKLSKESAKNNTINNAFYREQLRLASMPIISLELPEQKDEFEIQAHIDNVGNLPAFNIDIWLISTVHNEDFPVHKLHKFAKGKENRKWLKKLNDKDSEDIEFYALYDRGNYSSLQGKHRIVIKSIFKFSTYSLDLVIQYKDHLGNNYYQRYRLSYTRDNKRLVIEDVQPETFEICERFDLVNVNMDFKTKELIYSKSSKLPKELDFLHEMVKNGINAESLTKKNLTNLEYKWKIEKL